ncbi:DEAD/DEAH box helicase [Kitasatospora sp. MBT63]|uniref:DEAD/DEAH box helicase n=1 Tax=Kitasatospora sp. MBT63 TaxID=1444768 RepID=UPI00068D4C81|nr:DEAD/DEAH box helicase [Kitasatospora sp. MBT63]
MGAVKPGLLAVEASKGVKLRGHQEEAVAAIVRGLTPRPGQSAPNGLRVTVQMATGTGKSYVGAFAAQRLAPRGVVLVVVPTLNLLTQMIGSWLAAGRSGEMRAVCSLVQDELPVGVQASTNGLLVASWIADAVQGRRPLTLFATYASVGAVADAYAFWARAKGELLAPLDLMVCDEAHRSSGHVEKTWTVVHDQGLIPAARRLYATATPRIWAPPGKALRASTGREGAHQPLPEELAVSMDDVRIYGPMVFSMGLAEAVEKSLLAPFEVVVVELRDPRSDRDAAKAQPVPWGAGVGEAPDGSADEVPAEQLAAMQAGLLKVAAERGLKRTITFHNRTLEARYFSETLNQTVERLHKSDPEKYPAEVWSQWLSGEHSVDFRAEVIGEFGLTEEDDGLGYRVIAQCKVLGEGVDIPNADSVLISGRGSMVDIVQAVGRALRVKPGEKKTASLIVPVFLKPGERPGDILESDSYNGLVKILAAFRSHDERMVEALAVPQRSSRRTTGRSAEAAYAPGEGHGGGSDGTGAFTLPVRFESEPGDDVLALFIASRVLKGETQLWREAIGHVRNWYKEHGHLDAPYAALVGENGNYPLGRWLSDRRVENAAGELAPWRVEQLDGFGMIWSVSDARFEAGLSWARVWAKDHGGSLAAPARASIGGYAIGTWLAELRSAAQVPEGELGALAPERRRALEEIDPWWCPAWPIAWQRTYSAARQWWLESDGQVEWAELPESTVFEGEQLGRWVLAQRASHPGLETEQQELLAAIGIEADPELVAAKAAADARPKVSRTDRFALGIAALAAFVAEHDHPRVPRPHRQVVEVEAGADGEKQGVIEVALGAFLNNAKARRAKLTPGQLAQLAEHGVEWAQA